MIAETIRSLLVNFTLTFFVIGLISAAIRIARSPERSAAVVTGALLNGFLLWSVGVSSAWNFIVHSVFGEFSAQSIGWAQSPFQLEVAFSSLGFALIAFLACLRTSTLRLKLASVLGFAVLLWGAAGGHVYQLLVHHDTAPNNAGIILWTDLLLPAVALVGVWAHHRALRAEEGRGRHETDELDAPTATVARV